MNAQSIPSRHLPWARVVAINTPDLDDEQVISILRQPRYFPKRRKVQIAESSKDGTHINLVDGAEKLSLMLFHHPDRRRVPWQSLRISHVVQCSDMSVLQAQAHLHEHGARRVLVAGKTEALQFDPNAQRAQMRDQIHT